MDLFYPHAQWHNHELHRGMQSRVGKARNNWSTAGASLSTYRKLTSLLLPLQGQKRTGGE